MADKNKPTAAPATPAAPAEGQHRNYNERRWMKPSKRAVGYAKDRRAKVGAYGARGGRGNNQQKRRQDRQRARPPAPTPATENKERRKASCWISS